MQVVTNLQTIRIGIKQHTLVARGSRIFRLVIPARMYFTRGEENLWWPAMQISLPLVQNLYQAHDWFVT